MTTIQQPLLMLSGSLSCVSTGGTDSFWAGVLGKGGNDAPRSYSGSIDLDSSGNLYGAGMTKDQQGGNLNPYTFEGYVFKLNSSGDLQWQRTLGDSGLRNSNYDTIEFTQCAVSSSGDVYAAGSVYEYNTGSNDGPKQIIIAKWNTSGALQWQKKVYGNGAVNTGEASYPEGSGLDSSDNFYIWGRIWVDRTCAFVAKFNSSGTLQWQRRLYATTAGYSEFNGGHVTPSGELYLGGMSSFHTGGSTSHSLLTRWDSSGNLQWQKLFTHSNGTQGSRFHGLDLDSNGNIFCTASWLGISKWNPSGTLLWQKSLNGEGGWDCACDECGNVYQLYWHDNLLSGSSDNDLQISKWDTSGNLTWQRAFGHTAGSDYASWGGITISDKHTICIGAGTEAIYTGNNGSIDSQNAMVIKLPNDGSLTGPYTNGFQFQSTSSSVATTTHTVSNASLTTSTSGCSVASSSFPEQSHNNNYTKTVIMEYNTPNLNITTDIASTYSTTAGSGQNFVVAASDNANSSGSTITYQWKYSTNSGSTWTDIAAGEGGTSATLTRYATSYYSDNGHQIKCAMTATNPIGSNTKDSTVCTLTVNRNMTCSGSPTTGTQWNVSGDGLKPSGTNNDETWGNWNPGWSNVCEVGASMNMRAAGRCGFCQTNGVYQGWNMKLQLQIVGGGTVRYYHEQTKSSGQCGNGSHGDFSNFSISSQSWDPSWGSPEFRVQIIADGTNCGGSAGENIFAEQYNNTGKVDWSYKTATYNYDTRP